MLTFIEVVKDLWAFVADYFLAKSPKSVVLYQAPMPPAQIPLTSQVLVSVPTPVLATSDFDFSSYIEKAYVLADIARVFLRPVWSYDCVLFRLPFAAEVQILAYEGRFARITIGDKSGFILKDEITTKQTDIFPEFHNNEIYTANHPDTKKLRKFINDEFFAEEMFLPLQAVELLLYRLTSMGRKISWPESRPRLPGTWQNLLKGKLGVQIGVSPKAGSVIEYNRHDGTGFVGYTKAVLVDESIVIEGVGRLIEGEFKEEAISKDEWHEWRPVWITIS